jgi:hypothetical protein
MAASTRIVERLRLRGDSESAVRRAVVALEDAFRTATLPDVGAQLVFVRRLDLGRLPRSASPQTVSRQLESRFIAGDCNLVHADDPSAEQARAVWFRDPLEAHVLAARRVATGGSTDAWFWRRAVPALSAPTAASAPLRALAFSVAALEEASAALPVWTASLVLGGHGGQLLAALRPGDGAVLLQAADIAFAESAFSRISAVSSVVSPASSHLRRGRYDTAAFADERDGTLKSARRGGAPVDLADDRAVFVEQMVARTNRPPATSLRSAGPRQSRDVSTSRQSTEPRLHASSPL